VKSFEVHLSLAGNTVNHMPHIIRIVNIGRAQTMALKSSMLLLYKYLLAI